MHGYPKDELPVKASDVQTVTTVESTSLEYFVKLTLCIVGLQVSYVTWGVLQVSDFSFFLCICLNSFFFLSLY